jgi:hypothetical protein
MESVKRRSFFMFLSIGFCAFLIQAVSSCGGGGGSGSGSGSIAALVELIPGSTDHNPDGTWWGYNMNKIVRYGDRVFMYVVETGDFPPTASTFRIYTKLADGAWTSGEGFPTSRPGNLLMDSTGVLHVFVFEPTNLTNDSIGRLKHYWFPNSMTGDITNYQEETVVQNNGSLETVNIRIGSAIGAGDRLAVAFGLTVSGSGQTEQLWYKDPSGAWTNLVAGTNLDHDFYYPFVLVTPSGFGLLAVQDDFVSQGEPNIYQIIKYFHYTTGSWVNEDVVDLTGHALAVSRDRLLEQSDLYLDTGGSAHLLWKEFLDSGSASTVSGFKHLSGLPGSWTSEDLTPPSNLSINWLKMLEHGGKTYYLATSYSRLYLADSTLSKFEEVSLPSDIQGIYLYVAGPQSGTSSSSPYLDILLLNGSSSSYPDASNYYIRINKSELSKLD